MKKLKISSSSGTHNLYPSKHTRRRRRIDVL